MEIIEIHGMPDYSEIIDLINEEWPTQFGKKPNSEKIEEMVKSHDLKTDTTKYLYDENKIIGFYRFSVWPRGAEKSSTVHIMDISLLHNYQKKGLGKKMLEDLIDDCRTKEIETILSRTYKENIGSIKLHKSMQFSLHLETDDSFVWELRV